VGEPGFEPGSTGSSKNSGADQWRQPKKLNFS